MILRLGLLFAFAGIGLSAQTPVLTKRKTEILLQDVSGAVVGNARVYVIQQSGSRGAKEQYFELRSAAQTGLIELELEEGDYDVLMSMANFLPIAKRITVDKKHTTFKFKLRVAEPDCCV